MPQNRGQWIHLVEAPYSKIPKRQIIVVKPGGRGLGHRAQLGEAAHVIRIHNLDVTDRRARVALGVQCFGALDRIQRRAHRTVSNRVQV